MTPTAELHKVRVPSRWTGAMRSEVRPGRHELVAETVERPCPMACLLRSAPLVFESVWERVE